MTSDDKNINTGLAARIKIAIAGLALAGVLAGGAAAIVDSADPVGAEDTSETASGWWTSARSGLSWQ